MEENLGYAQDEKKTKAAHDYKRPIINFVKNSFPQNTFTKIYMLCIFLIILIAFVFSSWFPIVLEEEEYCNYIEGLLNGSLGILALVTIGITLLEAFWKQKISQIYELSKEIERPWVVYFISVIMVGATPFALSRYGTGDIPFYTASIYAQFVTFIYIFILYVHLIQKAGQTSFLVAKYENYLKAPKEAQVRISNQFSQTDELRKAIKSLDFSLITALETAAINKLKSAEFLYNEGHTCSVMLGQYIKDIRVYEESYKKMIDDLLSIKNIITENSIAYWTGFLANASNPKCLNIVLNILKSRSGYKSNGIFFIFFYATIISVINKHSVLYNECFIMLADQICLIDELHYGLINYTEQKENCYPSMRNLLIMICSALSYDYDLAKEFIKEGFDRRLEFSEVYRNLSNSNSNNC